MSFDVVQPLKAPSRVRVAQQIVLTVALKNVGTKPGSPWLAVSNLMNVAPLVACLPKCTRRGSFFGLEYLQFPPIAPSATSAFRLTFRAPKAGEVQYTAIVSGRPQPLLADADHAWTLDLAIVP